MSRTYDVGISGYVFCSRHCLSGSYSAPAQASFMPVFQFSEGSPLPPIPVPGNQQLVAKLVDGPARSCPQSVWTKIPRSNATYDEGYRKVTYERMSNAINGMAWWLKDRFGDAHEFETLAYIGVWDLRYCFLILGAVKAGYKIIFPSRFFPSIGLSKLLGSLDCTKMLTSDPNMDPMDRIARDLSLSIHEVPSVTKLLEKDYKHFPYAKSFATSKDDPFLVAHTSGTTGFPTPLILSQAWATSYIQIHQTLPPDGYLSFSVSTFGSEVCSLLPASHMSGILTCLLSTILNQETVVFPLADATLGLDTAMNMIRNSDSQVLLSPPFVLEALASDPKLIEEVRKKISVIGFGGAPLSKHAGAILSRYFDLWSLYGSTEIGSLHRTTRVADRRALDIWRSEMFHPDENIQFRPVSSGHSSHEAVVVRNDPALHTQAVFELFPKMQEFATKDLFCKDPHHEGYWIYQGRVDDVISLSSGENVNAMHFEQAVVQCGVVSAAVLIGHERTRAALLVQLKEDFTADAEIYERIWESISDCNDTINERAHVDRFLVSILPAGKSLPKSLKGTVQRADVYKMFADEIEKLYASAQ